MIQCDEPKNKKKQRKEAKRGTKNEQQLTAVTHKDGAPHTIICSYFFFLALWLISASVTYTDNKHTLHAWVCVCMYYCVVTPMEFRRTCRKTVHSDCSTSHRLYAVSIRHETTIGAQSTNKWPYKHHIVSARAKSHHTTLHYTHYLLHVRHDIMAIELTHAQCILWFCVCHECNKNKNKKEHLFLSSLLYLCRSYFFLCLLCTYLSLDSSWRVHSKINAHRSLSNDHYMVSWYQ